jgi:TPR repeat protein
MIQTLLLATLTAFGVPLPDGGCTAIEACDAACARGDGASCARAGALYQHPRAGLDRDDARAWIYFDRGCRLGNQPACGSARGGYRYGYYDTPDIETALARDQKNCDTGDPNACRKLATLHFWDGKYAALEQRACDLGSAVACHELAQAYATQKGMTIGYGIVGIGIGDPPPGPPGLYRKLIERACQLGRVPDCVSVGAGEVQDRRRGPIADRWRRAKALLDPLCRRGEPEACRTLGELADEVAAQPEKPPGFDAALAMRLYDHACELRDADGCRLLGVALLKAQGFAGDTTHARAVLNTSCALGSWRGCVAASQITPVKREAQYLIDRACDSGARGLMGIYANAGMPELPQPLNCGPRNWRR